MINQVRHRYYLEHRFFPVSKQLRQKSFRRAWPLIKISKNHKPINHQTIKQSARTVSLFIYPKKP